MTTDYQQEFINSESNFDNANEEQDTVFLRRLSNGANSAFHSFVDATILNTHPCGANIDGSPRLNGHFTHDVIDATILNKHPSGANIDGMPRMDGEFAKDVADATVFNTHPSGGNIDHTLKLW